MSTETADLTFSDEIADMAADALRGYAIAESDLIDAGSEVLQAAGPALVAAVLRRIAATAPTPDTRADDAEELAYHEGLREMARRMRTRADELDPSA